MAFESFRAIVPAGGSGTRLWPKSRRSNPKFLHDFTGSGTSLLQGTVDRLAPIADEVLIVTGDVHAGSVKDQVPECGVITEPSPKNSMPAIALAAGVLSRRYPREDLVVGSFAADHLIAKEAAFHSAVRRAVEVARSGEVVTIGITPTHPATGFGYIGPGAALAGGRSPDSALRVAEFVEKPDAQTAAHYVQQGYLWNAGMYVARASVLLDQLTEFHPELAAAVAQIAAAWDTPKRRDVLTEVWPGIEEISIDHAIAEPLAPRGQVAVVPADLGWSDIGDWDAIAHANGNGRATVIGDDAKVLALDAPGAVVVPERQVVVVGIDGAVVVETPDAILVTTREHAQQVKDAVDELDARGLQELL